MALKRSQKSNKLEHSRIKKRGTDKNDENNDSADNANKGADSSFLELIRPMIMNQVSSTVKKLMDSQMGKLQDIIQDAMTNHLTLI